MVKMRSFPDKNYRAVYFNGKTIRFTIDDDKPIEDLDWPEFYDIKLTNNCIGHCPWCYQESIDGEKDYEAVHTLNTFFGNMTENQKPFQIAYGGGEPTGHYQFSEVMKLTRDHGIAPNYTSNGMFVHSDKCEEVIETTEKHCEGVALSCHPHLRHYWEDAANLYVERDVFLNFHNIIGDKKSVDDFFNIYDQWHDRIKYFVLLPLIAQGREGTGLVEYDYFFDKLEKLDSMETIAFGANFYEQLVKRKMPIFIYEPEIMSKYLDLKNMMLYPSSFATDRPIRQIKL